jgi:hypothetical protein
MLSERVNELEKQMAKGKGMFAGAMMISMGLGGLGSTLFSKWFN